ncbi:TetR/AcrR family transcriptional regulator [Xanthovirga aplysinae]|uniref:TetR/AcrR family transcriptional regulator n=1 Tax=Xanthovirga aplysinae TaxID=2529853 RepID=UPI0012BD25AF|nr:TetR/AcrR family transcriptional regulator [Xanthovirga aplysinae]MTI29930.1 TetR/AcrR family transcriptional regulator [Xanthovirga aplysinae]
MARTKAFNPEETLEKALQVFWRQGYEGTSMQELVDEMGINRASMYCTYGDKHALFISALRSYGDKHLKELENFIASSQENALNTLKAIIYGHVKECELDQERKGCFLQNSILELANSDNEVRNLVRKNEKQLLVIYESLIKKGQAENQIPKEKDPKLMAAYLYSASNGLIISGITSQNPSELKAIADQVLMALQA